MYDSIEYGTKAMARERQHDLDLIAAYLKHYTLHRRTWSTFPLGTAVHQSMHFYSRFIILPSSEAKLGHYC